MYGSNFHGARYYASDFYTQGPATESCDLYYGSQQYGAQYYASRYFGCNGTVPPTPEPEQPGVFSGAGLPGRKYKRRERAFPRIKWPHFSKPKEQQAPVEAHVVLRVAVSGAVTAIAPDPVDGLALYHIGGMWRQDRMVMIEGMWREVEMRQSWQYQINGHWTNYDDRNDRND